MGQLTASQQARIHHNRTQALQKRQRREQEHDQPGKRRRVTSSTPWKISFDLAQLKKQASQNSCLHNVEPSKVIPTDIRYAIVLDFETTCWAKKEQKFPQEIIEFPAVLLDVAKFKCLREFHSFVKPQVHTQLSTFCKELTHIRQKQIDKAPPLSQVFPAFLGWLGVAKHDLNFSMLGEQQDSDVECQTKAIFVTWTDFDLLMCLRQELSLKKIGRPQCLNTWMDLKKVFRRYRGQITSPNLGVKTALDFFGRRFKGREHSGIVDARNTGRLLFCLLQRGVELKPTHEPVSEKQEKSQGVPETSRQSKNPYLKTKAIKKVDSSTKTEEHKKSKFRYEAKCEDCGRKLQAHQTLFGPRAGMKTYTCPRCLRILKKSKQKVT
eukprot:m.4241 g.4241  ORF g.4241 m.4241 type:complete len:380 (-) comp4942_c0_seq1:55-1194(-)